MRLWRWIMQSIGGKSARVNHQPIYSSSAIRAVLHWRSVCILYRPWWVWDETTESFFFKSLKGWKTRRWKKAYMCIYARILIIGTQQATIFYVKLKCINDILNSWRVCGWIVFCLHSSTRGHFLQLCFSLCVWLSLPNTLLQTQSLLKLVDEGRLWVWAVKMCTVVLRAQHTTA